MTDTKDPQVVLPEDGVIVELPEGKAIENNRIARYMTKDDRQLFAFLSQKRVTLDDIPTIRNWLIKQVLAADSLAPGDLDRIYKKINMLDRITDHYRTDLTAVSSNRREDIKLAVNDKYLELEESVGKLVKEVMELQKK